MAVEVPYNHPVFAVWLKNVEIDCFVGWTVEVTGGQVSVWEMSLTVMYSVSAFSDLWTSVDGILVLTSVSTLPLGLSARSARCISYPRMENMCVLLRWVSWMQQTSIFLLFEELLKFKFLLSHPFCIPMHDAKCLVTCSSTLSSPGHQKRIRATVSRIGWALLRLRAQQCPTLAAAHQDDTTTIQR